VGLAKIIAQEYSAVTGAVGTLAWSSPEMLLGARCTEKSDCYSFGERGRSNVEGAPGVGYTD